MVGLALLLVLAPPGDNAWPPPAPTVTLPSGAVVDAQLGPRPIEPATSMCAREVHDTATNACSIVRFDGGTDGYKIVGGSKQSCDVATDAPPAAERRYVFDESGNLRERIEIDKKTGKAGGNMYRWQDGRLVRIEHWGDFKSGKPVLVESFVYDQNGQVIEFSREEPPDPARRYLHTWHDGKVLTTTQVGTGTIWSYTWTKDRLITVSERPAKAKPAQTNYGYDKSGNVISEEYRRGDERIRWTGYSYDKQNRLVSAATDDKGGQSQNMKMIVNADGSTTNLSAPVPDGKWDTVTRYYYDCGWIEDGDKKQALPPVEGQVEEKAEAKAEKKVDAQPQPTEQPQANPESRARPQPQPQPRVEQPQPQPQPQPNTGPTTGPNGISG